MQTPCFGTFKHGPQAVLAFGRAHAHTRFDYVVLTKRADSWTVRARGYTRVPRTRDLRVYKGPP